MVFEFGRFLTFHKWLQPLAIYEITNTKIILSKKELKKAIKEIPIIVQMVKNFLKFQFNIFSWFVKIFARLQQF